jgi:serine/threonine-protein kinase PknK
MTVVATDVAFGVLGEVRAVVRGEEVTDLGGPQSRALLAGLVVAGGRVVGVEQLVDAVWAGQPPSSVAGTLHAYVSRLRKALGPAGPVLERRGPGYRLAAPETAFDWWCFEDLAERGRAALLAGDAAQARELLVQADALWRGEPLAGLGERPFAAGVVARLQERREAATGDRHEAELQLGRHASLLGELAEAVQQAPLDEARWARLALARYRSGQQAEALKALADARRTLVDELGVEPGQALRDLELQVLRQDPALAAPPAPAATAVPPSASPARRAPPARWSGAMPSWPPCCRCWRRPRRPPGFGVVEGEPGIGKTRLVEELAAVASARGSLVLWGTQPRVRGRARLLAVAAGAAGAAGRRPRPGRAGPGRAARRPRPGRLAHRPVLGHGRRGVGAAAGGGAAARRRPARRPAVGRPGVAAAARLPRDAPRRGRGARRRDGARGGGPPGRTS